MTRRPLRPPAVLAARLEACVNKIHRKAVQGYLITSRTDQYYFTGFDGEDGAALLLPGRVYLVTDGRFKQEAADTSWAKAIIRTGPLAVAVGELVRKLRIRRLGFQPEAMSVQQYRAFQREVRPARLVPMPPVSEELRVIKDPAEVAILEKAVEIAQTAFLKTIKGLRPGTTERELAAELEYEMIRRGASGPSFPTIVAEGPRAALPHAVPGDRRIREGSAVLIDWGAMVGHYRSDLTRVVFVRRIPPRFRRMYEAVLSAQREAIQAIAPGVTCGELDSLARRRLKGFRLDRYFTHTLGHAVGLDIHEPPRLSQNPPWAQQRLRPGMVITVEPGVYLPGIGGVRIEDDVLVTESGHRVLSNLPGEIDAWVVK